MSFRLGKKHGEGIFKCTKKTHKKNEYAISQRFFTNINSRESCKFDCFSCFLVFILIILVMSNMTKIMKKHQNIKKKKKKKIISVILRGG